jgi:hypothetical protein
MHDYDCGDSMLYAYCIIYCMHTALSAYSILVNNKTTYTTNVMLNSMMYYLLVNIQYVHTMYSVHHAVYITYYCINCIIGFFYVIIMLLLL